jgi:hypothetical protein
MSFARGFKVGILDEVAGPADAVVSGMVLNFLPDQTAAVTVMRGVASGGVVQLDVWEYAGRMELIRQFWDAARVPCVVPPWSSEQQADFEHGKWFTGAPAEPCVVPIRGR